MTRQASSKTPPGRNASPGFRTDIEGLRAVGVLLVVAFHASVPHLAGGFVGVDVFFVISGFLITGLLLREWDATGRISLQDFYARRVRRILPAACVVLAATAVVMPLFLDPLRAYRSVLDLAAALLYVGNWRFIHQNNDYLAASNDHSPALHYWSLSVEEQFYLVWPLLIVLCTWLALRWRRNVLGIAVVVLGAVVAASLALSLHQTHTNPNLAYMATTTRAWQFGVGGLLALLLRSAAARLQAPRRPARVALWTMGWLGALDLVLAAVTFSRSTVYPGTAALLPTFGAAAIILAGSSGPIRGGFGGVLSLRPVRWVGRVSYSWYLWHWPVIVLALAKWPDLGLLARVGLMLLALVLAALTQRFVERPAISVRRLRSRGSSTVLALVVTVLAATAVGASGAHLHSGLQRQETAAAGAPLPKFRSVFGPGTSSRTSGAVIPSPVRASSDAPEPLGCLVGEDAVEASRSCVFGPVGGKPVVLFGDSHAQQWQTPMIRIAESRGWRLYVITHAGCSIAQYRSKDAAFQARPECLTWRAEQMAAIAKLQPAAVVVSSQNRYAKSEASEVAAWRKTFTALQASGSKVVYLQDTVTPPEDIPSCVAANIDAWGECAFPARAPHEPAFGSWEQRATAVEGVRTISLLPLLCQRNTCPAVLDGVLLYRDDSHITNTAARILQPELSRRLVRIVKAAE